MPRSHSLSSSLENTERNDLRNLQLGVSDFSHHNEYNLRGNATFTQNYGAVYNQTTNHIHYPTQPKLPPLPRCPAPSPNYTHREDAENHMHSYFLTDRRSMKRYVLYGLGGTGKTELLLNLVDKHCYTKEPDKKLFQGALWIDATTEETIEASFKAIGLSRGVGSEIGDVLRSLASDDTNWIVVFNNADNPKLDLAKYFPKCSHGNIVITTRNYHARRYGIGSGSEYEVSEMTADEALALFRKHARLFDDANPSVIETAKVLVKEVGQFALAVTQAGAYISASLCSLSQYLDLYHDQRQELLHQHEKMHPTDDYPYRSLHATWMVSYNALTDEAKELIQVFSCVHHEDVKEAMFSATCSGGMDKLKSRRGALFTESEKVGFAKLMTHCKSLSTNGKWDGMKYRSLVSLLRSYSLVTFNAEKGTCSMHPLVHEWAGSVGDMEDRTILRQCTILLLGSSLIKFETAEELAFCRSLAFHVDRVFEEVTPKTSACGGHFGRVYSEAGRWKDAVVHQELLRELYIRMLGEEHNDTLTAMNDLALTYSRLGRPNDAEKLQLKVMETEKRLLGPEHPSTLTTMNNLASTYSELGRPSDAEKLLLQVMEGMKRILGPEHPNTLNAINNLALTYSRLGRPSDAEKLQLEVMEAQKRLLGPEHPSTLTTMNNLALTYSELGRPSDAKNLELEIMEARKRLLGPEHPLTLTAMNNLASTYSKLGRLNDAENLQLHVMETRKRLLGPEHPSTLTTMNNLALTYSELGRPGDAEKILLQVLEAEKRLLGPEHPDTLATMNNLAFIYSRLGRPSDAEKLQLEVMEAEKRVLGPEHPDTLNTMNNLASTYSELGRPSDAEKLLFQVMEARKRLLGPEHPSTLTTMSNLAFTYSELGRLSDAEKLLLQVMEARKRFLGPEHPSTLTTMSNLAFTYSELGRPSDAETLQLHVMETRKRVLGPEHPDTLTSVRHLASFHPAPDDLAEAEGLSQSIITPPQPAPTVNHPTMLFNAELLPHIEPRQRTEFFSFLCCFNRKGDAYD